MKAKALLTLSLLAAVVFGSPSPGRFYADLEQHLRTLGSLEIAYVATGLAFGDSGVVGHMIWRRPDCYLHETPEWIHCERGSEQWRYLRDQNTLILETAEGRGDWLPENALLNLSRDLKPVEIVTDEEGVTHLLLESKSPEAFGTVDMSFGSEWIGPTMITFVGEDGTRNRYEIHHWIEEGEIDSTIFTPPEVPAENLIDFRIPGDTR